MKLVGMQVGWNDRSKKDGAHGQAANVNETWFKKDDLQLMKDSGANYCEMWGIPWYLITKPDGSINEAYLTNWLDIQMSWYEEVGITPGLNMVGLARPGLPAYKIPVWMKTDFGHSGPVNDQQLEADIIHGFYDSNIGKMEPSRLKTINIFKTLAQRYGDKDVVFTLINEPLHHTWRQMSSSYATHLGIEYSKLMSRFISAIREHTDNLILVDRPYVRGVDNIVDVVGENVGWENHGYISGSHPELQDWKNGIDLRHDKFVGEFGRPMFQGEYGIHPPAIRLNLPDWKADLAAMVDHLDSLSNMIGRQWHGYAQIYGYAQFYHNYYAIEEIDYIMATVLKAPPEPPVPEPPIPEPPIPPVTDEYMVLEIPTKDGPPLRIKVPIVIEDD